MVHVAHDGDDRRTRDRSGGRFFRSAGHLRHLLLGLLFKRDGLDIRAKVSRQVRGQLEVERLVHSRQHALHHQAGNQFFGPDFKFFRQILYADAFRDHERTRDRQGLVRNRQAWRRRKALHRAFFGPLLITLSRTTRLRSWASCWLRRTRRRHASAHSWTRREACSSRTSWGRTTARLTRTGERRT